MQITFDLPHVFNSGSSQAENAESLRCLLDALIRINMWFLRSQRRKNRLIPGLYRSGVVYGRTEVWDTIPALYMRRYGDCKSLSAALISEYRMLGKTADPTFRWVINKHGAKDFHILVQTDNGFEDPSKILGMGKDENKHF